MNGVVLSMADQICPLLPYVGLRACSAATDLYLVGVAGWVFGGIGLLLLMGISEVIEDRKVSLGKPVAPKPHRTSFSNQLAIIEPTLHLTQHSFAARRLKHKRVRPLKRLHSNATVVGSSPRRRSAL